MSPKAPLILVVDDEVDILTLLEYNLERSGFRVIKAKDGPEAIELATEKMPDLIVLDIMLPDMEGTEVLKRLKQSDQTRHIPVIMLTAKGEEVDRIVGFELGAEDYITKPFSPRELILRIKTILKRLSSATVPKGDNLLVRGELTIDRDRRKVWIKGKEVELTTTEFELLTALVSASGRVLTRDMLLEKIWKEAYVTPRTVDTHIRRLRSKLGDAGSYIETVRGVGYRFETQ